MLSQKARYALRAMIELARAEAQVTAGELAVRADAPRKFLEAILLALARQGLVTSRRGKFDLDGEARHAMTIPWGDVYTSFVSTGIPNIEVYMGVSPATAQRLKKMNIIRPLLGLGLVQNYLKKKIRGGGPDDDKRRNSGCTIWGEVRNAAGMEVKKQLRTANGYDLTATAGMGILDHILAKRPAGGFYTASQMMGADYILSLPGTTLQA